MKRIISKFHNIAYPVFGFKKKPYKIIYSDNKIRIMPTYDNRQLVTIDDKNVSGDFFTRLLKMEDRSMFNITCRNIHEIIYSKIEWGLDINARPIDFTVNKTIHKIEQRKVIKIRDNLLWVDKISYPFIINTNDKIDISDTLYATLVFIVNEWVLLEFNYFKGLERKTIYL